MSEIARKQTYIQYNFIFSVMLASISALYMRRRLITELSVAGGRKENIKHRK